MPFYRVHIHPTSPILKGAFTHARKGSAVIHSDLLHSAFFCVSAWFDGYWLDEKAKTMRFSSAYPYFQDDKGKKIYLYPKPFKIYSSMIYQSGDSMGASSTDPDESPEKKKWKRIKYFSEGILAKLLDSPESILNIKYKPLEYTESSEASNYTAICTTEESESLSSQPRMILKEELKTSTVVDRGVSLMRMNGSELPSATTPFSHNLIRVNTDEGIGLWFIVELDESEIKKFNELLRILGVMGIGGRKAVGYGHFDFDPEKDIEPFQSDLLTMIKLNNNELLFLKNQQDKGLKPNSLLTLSLYHPTREEFTPALFGKYASYECTIRGGWLHSLSGTSKSKMSIRMCIEGSSFPIFTDKTTNSILMPIGDVVNLKYHYQQHDVWRLGLALGIAFHNKFIESEGN